MAPSPSPQEHVVSGPLPPSSPLSGDAVVISGMSGCYPDSINTRGLDEILYNKKNPITADNPRWENNQPELPTQFGKIPELEKFDAQFFKVHYRLGNKTDPMSRKLLEHSYQAIYDAGLSPTHLWGKKIGVYIGSCLSETEKANIESSSSKNGFGIVGCNKSMFANRISYWLNGKGPSMSMDAACSSGSVALEKAYEAISRGDCEAAIVGGANICMHPQSSVHYGRIMKLAMDGKTKSFDKDANGCARSEAINILFLQRAKDAKRIYANVCHVKSNFAPKLDQNQKQIYGSYRDEDKLAAAMKQVCDESGISPSEVEYVEAFGSAVLEADKSELEAISKVFCKNRDSPLLIGSVMSNIGYTEAASGITAVSKVLLAYQRGELAANLHCENPRDDVEALREGRMKVVTDHQPFKRTYAAVNSLSVTGINVHVLLHGHYKPKDLSRYRSNIPYLVTLSGRQESAVQNIFYELKSRPIDPEEIALLHNIHEKSTQGHLGRGYVILGKNDASETVILSKKSDYCDDAKRPLWFVYSGMGSQWAGMGAQLMRIPVFAAAIERCRAVLEPKGIDIVNIISSPDKTMFDNILHSFVGIAAVQIGLTDILRELGIVPDMIIGHSVGELGCAYADGCLSAEEMILSAYSRGLVSVQTPFIKGSMAAVGIGYQQMKNMVPAEIEIACHNGADSCTISGPADVMKEFVGELTAKGIFAKEVPCSNIAYHSRYIKEAGPGLLKLLSKVIKDPKPRSERWLSTSVPQDKWENESAKFCSAEYHTNNLLSPVLFEETSRLVPANAVVVEVAPAGLLQAILKRSLPASCIHVPLTRRGHDDNALYVLEAIGKLYVQGYNPQVKALYPKVEFPVSTGTPMLSHFIEWVHTEKWPLPYYVAARRKVAAASKQVISVHDDEHQYLKGHVIRDEIVYPYSGILVFVWDTLAMSLGIEKKKLSLQFENLQFHTPALLPTDRVLRLAVQLQKGNGFFEVTHENNKIVDGYVIAETADLSVYDVADISEVDDVNLTSRDIYKTFYDRGLDYRGEFRSILSTNVSCTYAQLALTENWVTFLDSMFQLNALRRDNAAKPRHVLKLLINLEEHKLMMEKVAIANQNFVEANVNLELNVTRCGGVVMVEPQFKDLPMPIYKKPVKIKTAQFVPYFQPNSVEVTEALNIFLQIVAENINKEEINIIEVLNFENHTSLQYEVNSLLNDIPGVKLNFEQINGDNISTEHVQSIQKADLVLIEALSTSKNISEILFRVAHQDIFAITTDTSGSGSVSTTLCRPVASAITPRGRLVLARWRPVSSPAGSAISVSDESDLPMLMEKKETLGLDECLVIMARYPPPYGLKEIVKKWKGEPKCKNIFVAMINPKMAQDVVLDQLPDFDLTFNIYNDGAWGGEYFVRSKETVFDRRAVALRSQEIGIIDSLHWVEVAEPGPEDIAVEVHYAGLSVRDARRAAGAAPLGQDDEVELGYGMDYSGVTASGDRVMGLVRGSAASVVKAKPSLLWPVPTHWSLEDAATVPLSYAHAFYCLGIKTTLTPGISILVNGASGGLGQALLHVALAHGCQVFATVGDVRKKRFLRRLFPDLPEERIGNSRDETFSYMVMTQTKGKGCSIVINCLKGVLKGVAIHCCASEGITLDVHQLTSNENFDLGMYSLTRKRAYYKLDFSSIFSTNNVFEMKQLQLMLSEGIAKGYVRPLTRVTYDWSDAPRALRLLSASRHLGRVLLQMKGTAPPHVPRLTTTSNSSHIVVAASEDNTLAVRLVDTLVQRGVKNIVLHSKHHERDGYLQLRARSWLKLGAKVMFSQQDLTTSEVVEKLVIETKRSGPVEGVYVINTGEVYSRKEIDLISVLSHLDAVTRKLCPSIKYFSVINKVGEIGRDICTSRSINNLPGTLVLLPNLDKFTMTPSDFTTKENALAYPVALQAVEGALRNNSKPVALVIAAASPSETILQHIAAVACVTITDNTLDDVTLGDLGLPEDNVKAVAVYMGQSLDLHVPSEEVPLITVKRLREVVRAMNNSKNETKGLDLLFSYVDPDELQASTDSLLMETLAVCNSNVRDDEFNVDDTYLILVPGLEGNHTKFRSFCERLKVPALVLQPGFENLNESVSDLAERHSKTILTKLKLEAKGKFYLLGYSFGALVALELAKILEKKGLEGTVFCIDAEPDTFSTRLNTWVPSSGEKLQNAIIQHMYTLIAGGPSETLVAKLQNVTSWSEKIDICNRELRGKVFHSSQYSRVLIEAAYARIQQARSYDPSHLRKQPLRAQVVYIRSKQDSLTSTLGEYTQKPLKVYEIDTDHARILDELACTSIVNRNLGEELLEQFNKRNLCETYLLNASTYLAIPEDII